MARRGGRQADRIGVKLARPLRPVRERVTSALAEALAIGLAAGLRAARASWRVDEEGVERLDRRIQEGSRIIVAFWHGKYFALYSLLQGRRACVFTSESFRGRVIAGLCRRFGYQALRLPRGGRGAGRAAMRSAMQQGGTFGLAVDGPLGPAQRVKRAVIELASELRCTVFPVCVRSRPTWRARRRWDAREFPVPFARVHLVVGPELRIPPDLAPDDIGKWGRRLEEQLTALELPAQPRGAGSSRSPS
jgi:lysophospholipid acyltransferase (LPLAT)-like uncharacterized protein